jgi:hypothetical protein
MLGLQQAMVLDRTSHSAEWQPPDDIPAPGGPSELPPAEPELPTPAPGEVPSAPREVPPAPPAE